MLLALSVITFLFFDNVLHSVSIDEWAENNKHMKLLENLPRLKKITGGKDTITVSELIRLAIKSFEWHIASRLLFHGLYKITDSIKDIITYITAAVNFISNIVKVNDGQNKHVTPFQFDLSLAVGKPTGMEEGEEDYIDYIGDIQEKLDKNGLTSFSMKSTDKNEFTFKDFKKLMDQLSKSQQDQLKIDTVYPFRKRFISMVDRRKSKNAPNVNDIVYLYEPPKGIYTRDIPNDAVSEWGLAACKTCLLPPMKYNENDAIGRNTYNVESDDEKQKKEPDPSKDTNIHALHHVKCQLLTFSFQVKTRAEIKCYLYWNGQRIRMVPNEIQYVFPAIFNMDHAQNKQYLKSQKFKDQVVNMDEKLIDKQFQLFMREFN